MIQCSSCGGSSPIESESCDYCGQFLLRLTPFERRRSPLAQKGGTYFRSLGPLYKLSALAGFLMMIVLYGFLFDSLSETQLVSLSPIWFLLLVFGICGMHAEKAVALILGEEAKTFSEALSKVTQSLPPFMTLVVYFVFSLPCFFLDSTRFSSPLLIATLTTGLWAGALYFFLFAIFPSL